MAKEKFYKIPGNVRSTLQENSEQLESASKGMSKEMMDIIDSSADIIKHDAGALEVKDLSTMVGRDAASGLSVSDRLKLELERSGGYVGQFIRGPDRKSVV